MANVSRVTPSGFSTETGSVSRVSPSGFLAETGTAAGFSGSPGAAGIILGGTIPTLAVAGPPAFVSRVAPTQFLVERGQVSRVTPRGFVVERVSNTALRAPSGGLVISGHVPLLTRSATSRKIARVAPRGFIVESGDAARVTPTGFIVEKQTATVGFAGSAGGAQCIIVTKTPTLVLSYFAGSPTAGNATLLGTRPFLSLSGAPGVLTPVPASLVATGVPLIIDNSSNFAGAAIITITGTRPTLQVPFFGSPGSADLALGGIEPFLAVLPATSQLSGRGLRKTAKSGLQYDDWRAFTEYKDAIKKAQKAARARKAVNTAEPTVPSMPEFAKLERHELAPTAKALKIGLDQLREAVNLARQAQDEDDLQALMLID